MTPAPTHWQRRNGRPPRPVRNALRIGEKEPGEIVALSYKLGDHRQPGCAMLGASSQ